MQICVQYKHTDETSDGTVWNCMVLSVGELLYKKETDTFSNNQGHRGQVFKIMGLVVC